MEPRSGDAAARRPRRRRNRKKLDAEVEGDAFLLQVSVILCACAALCWSLLQVILYQGDEPALVTIPLLYIAAVFPTAWYERYRLHRKPFKHLARVHLTMVCVLPALLQIESGGFARSGGVISWSSVSPFTACVIAKRIEQSIKWGILWAAVIAFAYGYEAYNETHERHGAALIAQAWHTGSDTDFHVVEVWTWQIYFYALATKVGVTLNACLLMYLLRSKTGNAVQAHKMLACAIMPPPVAKEVFEIQWKRLREGQRASRAATATKQRSGSVSIVSRVLNYVFANAGAGSSGGSRSGSGSRSRSFSGSSFTSRSSSSWSWGGIVRGKGKTPGGSDHSHTTGDSHSDGAATSSHDDGFEWTDDDYIAKRRQGGGSEGDARGSGRLESMSSTRAELAMDTTRGLADFAPTPTRSSLDEVKLEIPEDDDVDAGEGASGELAAHKELTNLRQVRLFLCLVISVLAI